MKHTREEILEFIQEVIETENGIDNVTEGTLLSECGLDSFGVTVLYLEMDEKYCNFGIDSQEVGEVEITSPSIILANTRIRDLIDSVMEMQ